MAVKILLILLGIQCILQCIMISTLGIINQKLEINNRRHL